MMKKIIAVLIALALLAPGLGHAKATLPAKYEEFNEEQPKPVYIYLRKNHKYAVCIVSAGMLGAAQVAETEKYMKKLIGWMGDTLESFFLAMFVGVDQTAAGSYKAQSGAALNQWIAQMSAYLKGLPLAKITDAPEVCENNPFGYAFSKSDSVNTMINALLAADSRNLAYGIGEDMGYIERLMQSTAHDIQKRDIGSMVDLNLEETSLATFAWMGELLFGTPKNPRSEELDRSKPTGARYLSREAGLGVYRNIIMEPWRQWALTRRPAVPFGVIRRWIEAWIVAGANASGSIDQTGASSSSSPAASPGAQGSNVDLSPVASTLSQGRCIGMVYGSMQTYNSKYSGTKRGEPNPELINMVKKGDRPDLYQLVSNAANKYGVNPDLYAAIIGAESSGKNQVQQQKNGGAGYAQLVAKTARGRGLKVTCVGKAPYDPCDERMNAEKALDVGASYLAYLINFFDKRYKSKVDPVFAAVLAYNQGEGTVQSLLTKGKDKNGHSIDCQGITYTHKILGIPGTALLEGTQFPPEAYATKLEGVFAEIPGSSKTGIPYTAKDPGTPALPPISDDEEPMKTSPHVPSQAELKRMYTAVPNYADADLLSQEEIYKMIGDFYMSEAFHKYVDAFQEAGVLKLRFPLMIMKYRLANEIRKLAQMNTLLKGMRLMDKMEIENKYVEDKITN